MTQQRHETPSPDQAQRRLADLIDTLAVTHGAGAEPQPSAPNATGIATAAEAAVAEATQPPVSEGQVTLAGLLRQAGEQGLFDHMRAANDTYRKALERARAEGLDPEAAKKIALAESAQVRDTTLEANKTEWRQRHGMQGSTS